MHLLKHTDFKNSKTGRCLICHWGRVFSTCTVYISSDRIIFQFFFSVTNSWVLVVVLTISENPSTSWPWGCYLPGYYVFCVLWKASKPRERCVSCLHFTICLLSLSQILLIWNISQKLTYVFIVLDKCRYYNFI